MIERRFIFDNFTAYDIHETIRYVHEHWEECVNKMKCISELFDCKFRTELPDFITHPETGMLILRDIWFSQHGIIYENPMDEGTVGTFSVTVTVGDPEECISPEEEDELCAAAALVGIAERDMVPNDIEFLHEEMEMGGPLAGDWDMDDISV